MPLHPKAPSTYKCTRRHTHTHMRTWLVMLGSVWLYILIPWSGQGCNIRRAYKKLLLNSLTVINTKENMNNQYNNTTKSLESHICFCIVQIFFQFGFIIMWLEILNILMLKHKKKHMWWILTIFMFFSLLLFLASVILLTATHFMVVNFVKVDLIIYNQLEVKAPKPPQRAQKLLFLILSFWSETNIHSSNCLPQGCGQRLSMTLSSWQHRLIFSYL